MHCTGSIVLFFIVISLHKGKEKLITSKGDRWKSDNFRENNEEEKPKIDSKKKAKKIKSDNFTRSTREKKTI